MPSPGEVQHSGSPSKAWIVACGAACAAVLGYGLLGLKDASEDWAYLVGYNLPIAVLLAAGLHFPFRKSESTGTSWLGFALIYASLLAASYIAGQRLKSDVRGAVVQVQDSLSALQQATSTGTTAPAPKPIVGAGSSEGAKMGVVLQTIVNRMLAQRREYELELDAIGWGTILDGERLKRDSTLSESRTMLQQATAIVTKYKSRTNAVFATMRADIESSDLSTSSKNSMLAGFDSTFDQGRAQAMELWALEEEVLGEFHKILDLLSARRRDWQIEGGQIMFQNQNDLDLFNAYVTKVQSLVAKQERMQSASLQRSKDTLNQVIR
jgi:hypothetical protein